MPISFAVLPMPGVFAGTGGGLPRAGVPRVATWRLGGASRTNVGQGGGAAALQPACAGRVDKGEEVRA